VREHPRHLPHGGIKSELSDRGNVIECAGGKLSGGTEHRERYRQIESGAVLAKRRRGEVHDHARVWEFIPRGSEGGSDSVARLLHRDIGKSDDAEDRESG